LIFFLPSPAFPSQEVRNEAEFHLQKRKRIEFYDAIAHRVSKSECLPSLIHRQSEQENLSIRNVLHSVREKLEAAIKLKSFRSLFRSHFASASQMKEITFPSLPDAL